MKGSSIGALNERSGWKKLESEIFSGLIDRVVVWRLDRLGRLAGETIRLLDDFGRRGVAFFSLRDSFDPSTPSGKLQANILASVAQFETEVRRERQMAGIAAAIAGGKKWGGRKAGTRITLTPEKEKLSQKLRQDGQTVASIARNLGISQKSVYKALANQSQ